MLVRRLLIRDPGKNPKTFLISGYTGLGHMVIRTVLVKKIEEIYKNCEIIIIAGNKYGTEQVMPEYKTYILSESDSLIKKIIFFLKLRKENIDVSLLTFDSAPKFLIRGTLIAGIPLRVGHVLDGYEVPDYYYTKKITVKKQKIRSEIDINLDLLDCIVKRKFHRDYIPSILFQNNQNTIDKYDLKQSEYITIQISGANGGLTNKLWPINYFKELINKLIKSNPNLKIIALGDKGDIDRVDKVCNNFQSKRLINLAGKTDIQDVKTLIYNCKFLIAHDSGLLHLGNALGKNIIALYGFSSPDYYIQKSPKCHIFKEACDCSENDKPTLFPGEFGEMTESAFALSCPEPECLKRITVDNVYRKCQTLINNL